MEKVIHRIAEVKPQDDLKLLVRFVTGETKTYDVKPLLNEIEAFEPLAQDRQLFSRVRVDGRGYGISWNEDIDLSSDELWINGEKAV